MNREQRLRQMIVSTIQGRFAASTGKDWSDCPYAYFSDAWLWWVDSYERELLRRELERVHKEAGV